MSKLVCGRMLIKTFCLIALIFTLASCGDIEFFPEYKKTSATPDLFSFTSKTKVPISETVTSDPITVSGLTADSSPVSIRGGNNSKYSINAAPDTDVAGTVKNGDKVTVSHTSAAEPGNLTTSTLTIGNVTGNFTSTTVIVVIPGFASQTVAAGAFAVSSVPITSFDGAPDTHKISVEGGSNAQYSIGSEDFFTNLPQTIPNLNGRLIFLRNRASLTGDEVKTTLTIDGVSSTFSVFTD